MYRLVPAFIQERYARDEITGAFHASVLFVDISGFTSMTESLMGHGQSGAETLAQLIRTVFDPLIHSVFEQNGFVTTLAGDAFTAVFPAESASSDAVVRALAAAWKIQQVMADTPRHQTTYGDFTISVKVGLSAGEVTWGILTSIDHCRATYYFQGPAVDGCALAEKLAQAGDVILDAAAFSAFGSMISAEPRRDDHFRITAINTPLPEPQPFDLQPVDPDISRRFFPLEALRQTHSGEFRQVVSLFVSLSTVRRVDQLQIFMQTIFNLQDRYGGLLNRLDFGDKGANLLLFWGAPVTHENDITRALNFILDLQAQTAIPVNAGITYGLAHAGYSGGIWAGEYTCHGRGITLAARMMQAAPRGEIWVDEQIAERAQGQFEVEFEAAMAFRGFAQKQRVFALLERREEAERIFSGEMIGRSGELKTLADFLQPLWERQPAGAMVIWGETGIGKSRLVHDFLRDLEDGGGQDFSVFMCQSDEILRESLNPFRYWLRAYFGQSSQQSDVRNKRSFNRQLDQLIGSTDDQTLARELDRTRSFLGALVNLHWPDSLYEQLDAKGRYENSLTALLSLLKAESLQRPVILFLEDLHWLDPDSGDFLVYLDWILGQDSSYPIAVIATARPEADRTALSNIEMLREIHLTHLAASDLATLAATQLGAPVGNPLLNLLVERVDGNPFFAEQILRYLQEQALIVLAEGEWQLQSASMEALPSDVSTILIARLDRLTEGVKEVVQTASVLGREFEIKPLAHMLHNDPTIREKVTQAESAAIWLALSELRYLFKHTLLRDTAYQMQVRTRRQALHRLASEALQDLYADDLGPHYGELAYHTEQAHLNDEARHYLELAGELAEAAYQNRQAVDYFSRALRLTPDHELDCRYRLMCAREELYNRLGARQDQEADLNAMSELAKQLDDASRQSEVRLRRAWLSFWTSDFPDALEWAQQAVSLAEAVGEYRLTGEANFLMSWVCIEWGDFVGARRFSEQALGYARRSDDRRLEVSILNTLGHINRSEGNYFAAWEQATEAVRINRDSLQSRAGLSNTMSNLGVILMGLGDYEAAQEHFEEALEIARETGSGSNTMAAFMNLSWVGLAKGERDVAIINGEAGIAIAREIDGRETLAEGLLWLGHAWSGLGQIDKAFAAYEESCRMRRELGQEHFVMGVLAGMARAALANGDLDSASSYVAEIMSYLERGGSLDGTWEPLRIYLTCVQVLQATKDSRANVILETAYQRLQQQASKIRDMAMRRRFLEDVPWNRDLVAAYRQANP